MPWMWSNGFKCSQLSQHPNDHRKIISSLYIRIPIIAVINSKSPDQEIDNTNNLLFSFFNHEKI